MWKCLEPPDFEDDRHWRWGLFYHNPEDARLIVPHRHGRPGVTVNLARLHLLKWPWQNH